MASIGVINTLILLGSVLVLAGILSSLVASRFGAPLLLVFLVIGMLAGEDGPGGVVFSDYRLTYIIGSLALAVILFDGGLRTKFASFRVALRPALVLATAGVVLTAAIAGLFAMWLLGLGLLEGLLLGAIVASTDGAAVFFLLRTGGLQLKQRVGTTLEIESGTNDPVAVFLTIVIVEMLLAGMRTPGWGVLGALADQAVVGAGFGVGGGLLTSWVLNRADLPSGLQPVFVTTAAILIFGLASVAGGSGFLAIYLAGLVVGNRPIRGFAGVTSFHDAATWLAQIVMFLLLGLLVTPSRLLAHAGPALGIALALMLVARPVAVWLCLLPFRFSWRETAFISWVGLRGAVSIFLASIPMLTGLPSAELYFNVAFFVVLVSLLVQGWTTLPAARWLGVALPRVRHQVRRVELDLPGELGYEMVGYPVPEDSPILHQARIPDWARLVFVVRDHRVATPLQAGALQPGDHVYFVVPPSTGSNPRPSLRPARRDRRGRPRFLRRVHLRRRLAPRQPCDALRHRDPAASRRTHIGRAFRPLDQRASRHRRPPHLRPLRPHRTRGRGRPCRQGRAPARSARAPALILRPAGGVASPPGSLGRPDFHPTGTLTRD